MEQTDTAKMGMEKSALPDNKKLHDNLCACLMIKYGGGSVDSLRKRFERARVVADAEIQIADFYRTNGFIPARIGTTDEHNRILEAILDGGIAAARDRIYEDSVRRFNVLQDKSQHYAVRRYEWHKVQGEWERQFAEGPQEEH